MASTRRGRGRPTKLTPELADPILKGVKLGMPLELAAEACGVSRHTVLEWVRRGEERDEERSADPVFVDFANRYRQARAQFAQFCLQPCIEAIAGKRPSKREKGKMVKSLGAPQRAHEAKWHLARRFPEFWGQGREQSGVAEALAEASAASIEPPKINIILAPEDDEPGAPAEGDSDDAAQAGQEPARGE